MSLLGFAINAKLKIHIRSLLITFHSPLNHCELQQSNYKLGQLVKYQICCHKMVAAPIVYENIFKIVHLIGRAFCISVNCFRNYCCI